ncbi:MAG: hypothetical protein LIO71_08345 [Ruminococcus sp.]|nr:hypothetical protein [Ruminococcus sp.]
MLKNGFISLWRSILEWEWYDDINTTRLYIHLMLTVSFKDSTWHGVEIKRGSRVSSYEVLSKETNLSVQQIRTILKRLESTGSITRKKYPKFTVFTLNNYDKFQNATGESTGNQQGTNRVSTGNQQQYNKDNKDNKDNNSSLASQVIDYGYVPPNKKF